MQLYYADIRDLTDEARAAVAAELSDHRREKMNAYFLARDRDLCLAAGWLLDIALRRYGMREKTAPFTIGQHGKPHISGLHFSLSHSGHIAVCAMTSRCRVGVDIEELIEPDDGLISRVCAPAERGRIIALTGAERQVGFTRLWTAKESFVKYLGTGLSLPPEHLEFDPGPPPRVSLDGRTSAAFLTEWELPGYRLALCTGEKPDAKLVQKYFEETQHGTL